jgi:predicted RNase H-like HicB family nuclease
MYMPTIDYVIWREDEYWVSQCLNVEVASFGETRDEAIENLKDAVRLYLRDDDGIALDDKIKQFSTKSSFVLGHETLVTR